MCLGLVTMLDFVDVDWVLFVLFWGFCVGVEMVIKVLVWMVRVFELFVYCYHEIVYNKLVVDWFWVLGVVFVDSIDEVLFGVLMMLLVYGSLFEVVVVVWVWGSYVVDFVCFLVIKVYYEVWVRAGKGYCIVYVGYEGYEEVVGTMVVVSDVIYRVEMVVEVDALFVFDGFVVLLV